jgi:hypothetical protein
VLSFSAATIGQVDTRRTIALSLLAVIAVAAIVFGIVLLLGGAALPGAALVLFGLVWSAGVVAIVRRRPRP